MTDRPRELVLVGPKQGSAHVIDELRAAIVLLDDGDEAVPMVERRGVVAPLIASDPKRFEWVARHARGHANSSGKPVRIVRFTKAEELEVFHPDGRRSRVE